MSLTEQQQAELAALYGDQPPPPSVDQDLAAAMAGGTGSGGTGSVGKRSSDAARRELEAGEKFRRERTSGSMPPEVFELTEDQTETVPTVSQRAPGAMRSAGAITNQDIEEMAKSKLFPEDLKLSEEEKQGSLFGVGPAPVSIEQQYNSIEDPLDRMIFLKKRRDKVLQDRTEAQYESELAPRIGEVLSQAAISYAGMRTLSAVPGIASYLRNTPKEVILGKMVDLGIDAAVVAPYIGYAYDYFNSDDEDKKVEIEREVEELKQQSDAQKNSGSPAVSDESKDSGTIKL